MNSQNAIEVRNITKTFKTSKQPNKKNNAKRTTIIKDVTFNLKKSEVVGIIGRNGSGKSTLLKLISRIMEPDSGTIECFGKIASILELGLGFHQDLTGRENIYVKASMYCFSKKEIDVRIDSIIKYSELGDYIDVPLRLYSSGMIGKLAFAIMVNVDADVIILDEVLSTGDGAFAIKSREHIKKLKNSGRTILIVSHSINVISEICDRVIWIENGSVKEIGSAKLVCNHYETEIRESFEIVSSLADAGVSESQNTLGCMYRDGRGVEQDNEKALYWLRKASDIGNSNAQVNLGDMLLKGVGIESDSEASLKLYISAANRGNLDARSRVALLSGNNLDDLVQTELKEQFHNLAVNGGAKAKLNYANLLMKHIFSWDDKVEAFRWFKASADQGNSEGQYQTAVMYRDGFGVKKNDFESQKYFEFSGNNGNIRAMQYLGDAYLNGKIEHDEKKSFEWHFKAAECGNSTSQYQVATMYRDGTGTEKDNDASEKWFKRSTYSGLANFISLLADTYSRGMHIAKDDDAASKWYSLSADSGNANALYQIGMINVNGLLGQINIKNGLSFLYAAAERNDVRAMNMLGKIFKNGIGVEKNSIESLKWFIKSSELENTEGTYNKAMLTEKIESVDCTEDIRKAAEEGYTVAQIEFGDRLFSNGDAETALKWYIRAGEGGNPEARMKVMKILAGADVIKADVEEILSCSDIHDIDLQHKYEIADTFLRHAWTVEDKSFAFKLMHKLAEKNNVDAMYKTGLMYRDGIGTETDYALMEHWMNKAADSGNVHAALILGDAYRRATFGKKDDDISRKYYAKAAECNNENGMYNCALLHFPDCPQISTVLSKRYAEQTLIKHCNYVANHYLNNPAAKDAKEAIRWYERAIQLNNGFAMNQMAIQFKDGKNVTKNVDKSIELLRYAVKIGTWGSKRQLFFLLLERSTDDDLKEAFLIGKDLVSLGDTKIVKEMERIYGDGNGCGVEGLGTNTEEDSATVEEIDESELNPNCNSED